MRSTPLTLEGFSKGNLMIPYIFHRAEFFYVVELRDDDDAIACVEVNPGTLKIERINIDGSTQVIWPN
ncbi:MAG: hypothetical protein ABW118_13945 [Candidatus Thiodiazotropha sp.]